MIISPIRSLIRSLQRRLGNDGPSYAWPVQQARFNLATRMLCTADMKLIEIASECGYRNPASVSRAFKNTAGVSPLEYRRQQQPHQPAWS